MNTHFITLHKTPHIGYLHLQVELLCQGLRLEYTSLYCNASYIGVMVWKCTFHNCIFYLIWSRHELDLWPLTFDLWASNCQISVTIPKWVLPINKKSYLVHLNGVMGPKLHFCNTLSGWPSSFTNAQHCPSKSFWLPQIAIWYHLNVQYYGSKLAFMPTFYLSCLGLWPQIFRNALFSVSLF